MKLEHVAPVSCCNDAALLYKLDQVTTVGIDEFMSTFQQFWDDLTQVSTFMHIPKTFPFVCNLDWNELIFSLEFNFKSPADLKTAS